MDLDTPMTSDRLTHKNASLIYAELAGRKKVLSWTMTTFACFFWRTVTLIFNTMLLEKQELLELRNKKKMKLQLNIRLKEMRSPNKVFRAKALLTTRADACKTTVKLFAKLLIYML